MTHFIQRTFTGLSDRDSGRVFEDLVFERCSFVGCDLSITSDPRRRTVVRSATLARCEQRGCIVNAAVFHSVVIDGLKTNGLLQTWAAVFKHVTMRGKIGRVMLSDVAGSGVAAPGVRDAFRAANDAFYSSVDWALDISQAEFEECDLRGIPGKLVRRDVETQVLITRESAITGRWRSLDLTGTHWPFALDRFVASGADDMVLVAPKRNRKYERLLAGLRLLRESGVAV